MNNNVQNERALLGQFATSSYTSLGDPFVKKSTQLSRYYKKQFQTNPAKKGREKNALFGKGYPFLADGDKFNDKQGYLKTQPRENRKKGFLSSDAFKTDEFSNTIRTEQYRWQLGRESFISKMHNEAHAKREKESPKRAQSAPSGPREAFKKTEELGTIAPAFETPLHLYDIGKGKYVTPFSQKLAKENWYQSHRDGKKVRNMGDMVPSSYEIGNEMVQAFDLQKAPYAKTPIVRSTFYRPANVRANAGWAALPASH